MNRATASFADVAISWADAEIRDALSYARFAHQTVVEDIHCAFQKTAVFRFHKMRLKSAIEQAIKGVQYVERIKDRVVTLNNFELCREVGTLHDRFGDLVRDIRKQVQDARNAIHFEENVSLIANHNRQGAEIALSTNTNAENRRPIRKIVTILFSTWRAITSLFAVDRFPQYWEFFRLLLPKRVQKSAWEPTFWELMEDFYSVIDRLEGKKWLTRWIVFCFTVRTVLMYLQCLRAFAADATIGWLIRILRSIFLTRG